MKIPQNLGLPAAKEGLDYQQQVAAKLTREWSNLALQVNAASEGLIQGATNAHTAPPTTGDHKQGDFQRNSTPTELGSVGSKYVVFGWICTASGTPGTWKECRCLTGG